MTDTHTQSKKKKKKKEFILESERLLIEALLKSKSDRGRRRGMQAEPVSNGVVEDVTEAGHQPRLNGRHADLSLQIPQKPPSFGSSHRGKGILQHQGSFKGSSALRSFLRGLSFKNKVASSDGEGSSLLEVPGSPVLDESIISALSWKRCVSLPVTPASHLSPSVPAPLKEWMIVDNQAPDSTPIPVKVSRSLSVPGRKNVVVVRSLSFAARTGPAQTEPTDDHTSPVDMEDDDEVIPEEEAVCRICLIELSEGGNIFKMECSCKGDLKLTHEECVVKWFCIKGNKNCDVCGQEVCNLPVAVLRKHNAAQREYRHGRNSQNTNIPMMSAWYDLVVLTLISSISYFFILEQLLIGEMKSQAIIVAAPFSFTLGLLGSMFAIIVASKEYIWTYAALEFILVAMILHLCYNILHLHAIYSVLLSAVAGFGLAISVNSLVVCIFAWRSQVTEGRTDSNPV